MNSRTHWNLPEELTVEILSRLPAKSAGRCRCVSKSWRALLSRPDFIKTHLHRSRNLRNDSFWLDTEEYMGRDYFYYYSLDKTHYFPSDKVHRLFDQTTIAANLLRFSGHPNTWTYIHGSCDGLLLVGKFGRELFVLNPVTKQIKEVPTSPLALNPSEGYVVYGFGYDSVSDDYKIVAISYFDDDDSEDDFEDEDEDYTEMFVDVYSLKTGTWRELESPPYEDAFWHLSPGIFVGGCIHWLAWSHKEDCIPSMATIIAFDLAQEKFRELPLPSSDEYVFVCGGSFLVELGGWLCTFDRELMDVWVMREYGVEESWTKFSIHVFADDDEDDAKDVYGLGDTILDEVDIDIGGIHPTVRFIESLVSPHGCPST